MSKTICHKCKREIKTDRVIVRVDTALGSSFSRSTDSYECFPCYEREKKMRIVPHIKPIEVRQRQDL